MRAGMQGRLAATLERGRAMAEARMLDEFAVMVATGSWVFDPDEGEDVEELALLFITPGRVKVEGGLAVRDAEVGGRTSASVVRSWHIPVGSPVVPAGALAICSAVHPTSDPTLLGARLRVGGPAPGSQTTARRLEVTEVLT